MKTVNIKQYIYLFTFLRVTFILSNLLNRTFCLLYLWLEHINVDCLPGCQHVAFPRDQVPLYSFAKNCTSNSRSGTEYMDYNMIQCSIYALSYMPIYDTYRGLFADPFTSIGIWCSLKLDKYPYFYVGVLSYIYTCKAICQI